MLLFLTAEKRGLFLQESRAGLVFTLFLNDLFIYCFFYFYFLAFVGGGAALHTTVGRATTVFGSSWPFGA